MRATISGIRLKFPAVKNISTGTLQKLLDGEELPHLEGVDHKQKKRKLFLIVSIQFQLNKNKVACHCRPVKSSGFKLCSCF